MDITEVIKQPFLGLVGCPREGRELKSMNQVHHISQLCLLASYLLWVWQATPSFQPALASYRLAHQPARSICQPKAGNLGTLCLNRGCSLPALSNVVPWVSLSHPSPPSGLKIRHRWCYDGDDHEAGRRGHLHNHLPGSAMFLTVCVKLTIKLGTPSLVAPRISAGLLTVHLNLLCCKHFLRNCTLVKGLSFFLVFMF